MVFVSPRDSLLLLMEEIPNNHLGCKKPLQIAGVNYQPQLVSRISEPSTVWLLSGGFKYVFIFNRTWGNDPIWPSWNHQPDWHSEWSAAKDCIASILEKMEHPVALSILTNMHDPWRQGI